MSPPRDACRPLGRPTRLAFAVSALVLVGLFALACWLEPDPRGYGTHERLGLPPCAFATITRTPCPSCGMTTAFAWLVRGNLARSWAANPAGLGLAMFGLAAIPWLLGMAVEGRPRGFRTLEQSLTLLVVACVAFSLLAWFLRLNPGRAL